MYALQSFKVKIFHDVRMCRLYSVLPGYMLFTTARRQSLSCHTRGSLPTAFSLHSRNGSRAKINVASSNQTDALSLLKLFKHYYLSFFQILKLWMIGLDERWRPKHALVSMHCDNSMPFASFVGVDSNSGAINMFAMFAMFAQDRDGWWNCDLGGIFEFSMVPFCYPTHPTIASESITCICFYKTNRRFK